MAFSQPVTLHNNVTTAGDGSVISVAVFKSLTLEIYGTSTAQTIIFEGASHSGTYYPMQGIQLTALESGTQTTKTGELWQFDITGLETFRARVTSVSGGALTIKGRASQ